MDILISHYISKIVYSSKYYFHCCYHCITSMSRIYNYYIFIINWQGLFLIFHYYVLVLHTLSSSLLLYKSSLSYSPLFYTHSDVAEESSKSLRSSARRRMSSQAISSFHAYSRPTLSISVYDAFHVQMEPEQYIQPYFVQPQSVYWGKTWKMFTPIDNLPPASTIVIKYQEPNRHACWTFLRIDKNIIDCCDMSLNFFSGEFDVSSFDWGISDPNGVRVNVKSSLLSRTERQVLPPPSPLPIVTINTIEMENQYVTESQRFSDLRFTDNPLRQVSPDRNPDTSTSAVIVDKETTRPKSSFIPNIIHSFLDTISPSSSTSMNQKRKNTIDEGILKQPSTDSITQLKVKANSIIQTFAPPETDIKDIMKYGGHHSLARVSPNRYQPTVTSTTTTTTNTSTTALINAFNNFNIESKKYEIMNKTSLLFNNKSFPESRSKSVPRSYSYEKMHSDEKSVSSSPPTVILDLPQSSATVTAAGTATAIATSSSKMDTEGSGNTSTKKPSLTLTPQRALFTRSNSNDDAVSYTKKLFIPLELNDIDVKGLVKDRINKFNSTSSTSNISPVKTATTTTKGYGIASPTTFKIKPQTSPIRVEENQTNQSTNSPNMILDPIIKKTESYEEKSNLEHPLSVNTSFDLIMTQDSTVTTDINNTKKDLKIINTIEFIEGYHNPIEVLITMPNTAQPGMLISNIGGKKNRSIIVPDDVRPGEKCIIIAVDWNSK